MIYRTKKKKISGDNLNIYFLMTKYCKKNVCFHVYLYVYLLIFTEDLYLHFKEEDLFVFFGGGVLVSCKMNYNFQGNISDLRYFTR